MVAPVAVDVPVLAVQELATAPWAVAPVAVAAVVADVLAARKALSGVAVPVASADASRRSSAGKSSTKWKLRHLAVYASARATVQPYVCAVVHR